MSKITLEDVELAWEILVGTKVGSKNLRVRELEEFATDWGCPLFAVDSDARRQFLIPVANEITIQEDKSSSGVQIIERNLIDNQEAKKYVVVQCLKPHLNELFSIILVEIIVELKKSVNRPDLVSRMILDRWRELLEREKIQRPAIEKILGIFGELWELREMVKYVPNRINMWVGPFGGDQDFLGYEDILEVKATLSKRRVININSLNQLQSEKNRTLHLSVMNVSRSGTGENLRDLVESVVNLGCNRYQVMERLLYQDFSNPVIDACEDIRFTLNDHVIYKIDSSFPKLTEASFINTISEKIISISYTLDLSTVPPIPLSENQMAQFYKNFK